MAPPREIAAWLAHGVRVRRFEYQSEALAGTTTRFHVVHRVGAANVPVLYYLSGLTCNDENCVQKGGLASAVANHGLCVVCPDTSPRGAGAPGEDDSYDFGTGAAFYVNATVQGFEAYQMETFVVDELPDMLKAALGDVINVQEAGIFGHSMGGHGALTLALRHPTKYKSVSAFAPITNPSATPWGIKALSGYLGVTADHAAHDATELVRRGNTFASTVLIDQGAEDEFLQRQLRVPQFAGVCRQALVNMRPGYGHSYYFVATFMDLHLRHHAEILGKCP